MNIASLIRNDMKSGKEAWIQGKTERGQYSDVKVSWKSAFPKILSKKHFIFINNVLCIGKILLFGFILCYFTVLASWLDVGGKWYYMLKKE